MNEDGTPIESGAAGAPEGAPVAEPSSDDVAKMYEELGIKAPVPTGKAKGRPKATNGGNKKATKQDDEGGELEKGRASDDSKDKSKTPPASDSDGADGNDADASGKKDSPKGGKDGGKDSKVSDDGDEDAEGVSKPESKDNEKTPKSGEEDADEGADGAGQAADDKGTAPEEGEDDEKGKRPGKSNPEVERRFQKLTNDVKERDQRIEELEKQVQETLHNQVKQQADAEDPEYTLEDFRKVRDEEGNILDLDENQAELAYRRWKDGYDQRATEREAKFQHALAAQQREAEMADKIMKSSVEAYDSLTSIIDEYPELDAKSDEYDQEFSDEVMPLIQELIIYAPGTEPGNEEGLQSVIIGMKSNPKSMLKVMRAIRTKKRSLPLNGTDDTVEHRSNVQVTHSRSSDPNVNAANELYKELGINKRI